STYCADTLRMGAKRIQQDATFFQQAPTPDSGAANNLYTFMAQRWAASLTNLDCAQIINVPRNPVQLTTDADGVVTAAVSPHAHGGSAPRHGPSGEGCRDKAIMRRGPHSRARSGRRCQDRRVVDL